MGFALLRPGHDRPIHLKENCRGVVILCRRVCYSTARLRIDTFSLYEVYELSADKLQ